MAHDAIVLGGGFYGCAVAVYLARRRGLRVLLLEAEDAVLKRASYHNQARIHGGYHYPRSFVTANRSRRNFPTFVQDWPDAVKSDFTKLYAIARANSKVTARQFRRFCREIGAPLEPASQNLRHLFDRALVEDVFLAQEYAFDSKVLAEWAGNELQASGVEILYGMSASVVRSDGRRGLIVTAGTHGVHREMSARLVFNCTYSSIRQIATVDAAAPAMLKHEITELGLLAMPTQLEALAVTLMDGPFFSFMPFPSRRGLHTLSHVRYTPHESWEDRAGLDPYRRLAAFPCSSRVDRMIRDVGRYLPAILDARHVDSMFEIKTVLVKNEVDDGRPILFHKDAKLPGYYAILGSKIDNIYDVLDRLDTEALDA